LMEQRPHQFVRLSFSAYLPAILNLFQRFPSDRNTPETASLSNLFFLAPLSQFFNGFFPTDLSPQTPVGGGQRSSSNPCPVVGAVLTALFMDSSLLSLRKLALSTFGLWLYADHREITPPSPASPEKFGFPGSHRCGYFSFQFLGFPAPPLHPDAPSFSSKFSPVALAPVFPVPFPFRHASPRPPPRGFLIFCTFFFLIFSLQQGVTKP